MGNPKQKWTSEEEEALRAGDKWRNMSAAVQGSREKLRTPKPKDGAASSSATPQPHSVPQPQTQPQSQALDVLPVPINIHDSSADHNHVKDDSAKDLPDGKIAPRYNEMIFEALSAVKEQSGLDIGSIVTYIELQDGGLMRDKLKGIL
ncbi:Telomere repeat-binding factor 4, partial [Bienertia sinuspersici]